MIANNLTNEELANLQEQYQHVSTEYQRVMTENRKLREDIAAIEREWTRHGCTMPLLYRRPMHKAITGEELP